jgi:thioredoxin-like negative regulator of GroEL
VAHGHGKGVSSLSSAARTEEPARPRLLFFTSTRSGRARRVEGYLAQVLQRRRNHETFELHFVDSDDRPDLVRRFEVDEIPTLVVLEGPREEARLPRPRGCRQIESFLAPWLR